MSVQVSYKKQTLLGFIGLLILFLSIEAIANMFGGLHKLIVNLKKMKFLIKWMMQKRGNYV